MSDAQLQLLGTEITYPGYKIHLPEGYQEISEPADVNVTTANFDRRGYGWRGFPHPDGGFPLLETRTISVLKAPQKPIMPAHLVKNELTKIHTDYNGVMTSSIESGLLNGRVCARAYWKGTLDNTRFPNAVKRLTHGFIYITWNSQTSTIVTFEGSDTEPYYSQTSKELEAAALTLKPN